MMKVSEAPRLIEEKIELWSQGFIQMLPNLALAVVIVIIGWLMAKMIRSLIRKGLAHMIDSKTLIRLIGNIVYMIVMLIGLFGALSVLHLDKTVTSILAGAGIIGLALGFAFQDIAANFISGILMAAQRPIRVGELIETDGHTGIVERIDLRTTEIRNLQGIQVIIPNKDVFQTVLINFTRNGTRRVELFVGVSYGEDLERVERITLEAVKAGVKGLLTEEPVELFFEKFGDSSINYEVRFWITSESQAHYKEQRSQAIKAIKAAYNREGITIPFPIRTLDFGIKGGEKLDAMLSERGKSQ